MNALEKQTLMIAKQVATDFFVAVKNLNKSNWRSFNVTGLRPEDIIYLYGCKANADKYFRQHATIKKAIAAYGEIPNGPLYRGISDVERESILHANKTNLARTMSFSGSRQIAKLFAQSGARSNGPVSNEEAENNTITVETITKLMLNLDAVWFGVQYAMNCLNYPDTSDFYDKGGIDVFEDNYKLISDGFNALFDDAQYSNIELSNSDIVSWLSKFPRSYKDVDDFLGTDEAMIEYEWLIPEDTYFIPIDRKKMIFKI